MGALPDVPGVVKLTLNWGVDGDVHAQTIHFARYTGTADAPACVALAEAAVSTAATEFQGLCTSFTGVLSATARDLATDMGAEETAGAPWTGTRTGDRLAPGTAFVQSYAISRHYRGGHARNYFPFGSGTDVAATGLWADAFLTAAETAVINWFADWTGSTYSAMVVGSHCQVSYYGPPNRVITGSTGRMRTVSSIRMPPLVNDVRSSTGRKLIASQRRRNRGA